MAIFDGLRNNNIRVKVICCLDGSWGAFNVSDRVEKAINCGFLAEDLFFWNFLQGFLSTETFLWCACFGRTSSYFSGAGRKFISNVRNIGISLSITFKCQWLFFLKESYFVSKE